VLSKVLCSAWVEEDVDTGETEQAGLIFINYTDEAIDDFHFSIRPSDYDLNPGSLYALYTVNETGGDEPFGGSFPQTFSGGDALYSSFNMRFPPNTVLAVRIVEQPSYR
jgi:hypothetical protein